MRLIPAPRFVIPLAAFGALVLLEALRPLRVARHEKPRRFGVNLAVAIAGGASLGLAYPQTVARAARWAARHRFGILRWLPAPPALKAVIGLVLLDYTLWWWHALNHRVPFLWRFHAAHHADVELDVSTAVRFHLGELLLSTPYRAAQAALIGVELEALLAWEAALLVFIEFHHSNLRLPLGLERWLRYLIITPRLHGTHHSVNPHEVKQNFGTFLSVWDILHRVHLWQGPHNPIAIGLPECRQRLTTGDSLLLPFTRPS